MITVETGLNLILVAAVVLFWLGVLLAMGWVGSSLLGMMRSTMEKRSDLREKALGADGAGEDLKSEIPVKPIVGAKQNWQKGKGQK